MINLSLILRRLRRWWHLRCLRARLAQLACHIPQLERDVEAQSKTLYALQSERRELLARVACTTAGRTPTDQPITWGL